MRFAIAVLLFVCFIGSAEAGVPARARLSEDIRPVAYRVDLAIVPDQARFSGHVEIDIELKDPSRTVHLHGRGLNVRSVVAELGKTRMTGRWTQVDPLGDAMVTFPSALPKGKARLVFDYDAPFAEGPAGLYRVKVGNDWYAWTQFQAIDARAAFPSFDQPGFKTPYTVSLAIPAGQSAISNARETSVEKHGPLVRHRFATTKPLPTYLVAFAVGPFDVIEGTVAPTPQRKRPLPLRIVATKGQTQKLRYALAETPRILTLLEDYFDTPFPFDKLDQIASPVMGGAMENAGAPIYDDGILCPASVEM
ncbi:MAG: hypothetical protein H0X65_16960 [Gemmatimonadetes bacterium]|nr:hypothetical protein [Gemmatimonadota bacterium]